MSKGLEEEEWALIRFPLMAESRKFCLREQEGKRGLKRSRELKMLDLNAHYSGSL